MLSCYFVWGVFVFGNKLRFPAQKREKRVFNYKVPICDKISKSYFQLAFFEKSDHFPISNLLKSPVQIKIDGAGIYLRCKKKLNFREPPPGKRRQLWA